MLYFNKTLKVHPQGPSVSPGPSCFLLITSSAASRASTLASPHQRRSIFSPSVPPLAYSAHIFCLSSTSLHLHCIADFLPKQGCLQKRECTAVMYSLFFNHGHFIPPSSSSKWDRAVTRPARITHAHKHACTHRHNPPGSHSHLYSPCTLNDRHPLHETHSAEHIRTHAEFSHDTVNLQLHAHLMPP